MATIDSPSKLCNDVELLMDETIDEICHCRGDAHPPGLNCIALYSVYESKYGHGSGLCGRVYSVLSFGPRRLCQGASVSPCECRPHTYFVSPVACGTAPDVSPLKILCALALTTDVRMALSYSQNAINTRSPKTASELGTSLPERRLSPRLCRGSLS